MVTRLGAPTEALEIQTVEVGEPGANQVRIAVEAFCLDFNDIDTIRGRYGLLKFEPPFVVGMAAAGTVEAAGPGCEGAARPTSRRHDRGCAGWLRVGGPARRSDAPTAPQLAQLRPRAWRCISPTC